MAETEDRRNDKKEVFSAEEDEQARIERKLNKRFFGVPIEIAPAVFGAIAIIMSPIFGDAVEDYVRFAAFSITIICQGYIFAKISKDSSALLVDKVDHAFQGFLAEQREMLGSHVKVATLSAREAEVSITSAMANATIVKNTYVNISGDFGAKSSFGRSSLDQYAGFLERSEDNEWHDITSYADIYEGRYQRLIDLQGVFPGRLSVSVIDGETDVINFLLTEDDSGPLKVFFGWIKISGSGYRVFETDDRNIVALFQNYFELLERRAIDEFVMGGSSESYVINARANKFIGRWISINLERFSLEDSQRVERFAVMDVKHSNNSWNITLKVFNRKTGVFYGKISTDMIVLSHESVNYRYMCEDVNNGARETGIGSFDILDDSSGRFARGRYCRSDAARSQQTIAMRIDGSDEPFDEDGVVSRFDAYLGEILAFCRRRDLG